MTHPLSQLRAQIDAIDDKLFALLKERVAIVQQVGELKSKERNNRCFIRSGREAEILRRVYAEFKQSGFSPLAAASMWRQIIAASLNIESPLKISVYSPENDATPYWLARDYFGAFTPLKRESTMQRVLADVADGRAHIGVLPLPAEAAQDDWWLQLAREGDLPKVFACVPFVTTKAEHKSPVALAIAYTEPEQTTDDISLYALKTDREISQSRLNAAFAKAGIQATWRASAAHADGRIFLVELKGFHAANSLPIQAFKAEAGNSLQQSFWLGAYATPIIVD